MCNNRTTLFTEGMMKSEVRVIPNPMRSEDISTTGEWSRFNLTWTKSSEITYGAVFYKVYVVLGGNNINQFVSNQCDDL